MIFLCLPCCRFDIRYNDEYDVKNFDSKYSRADEIFVRFVYTCLFFLVHQLDGCLNLFEISIFNLVHNLSTIQSIYSSVITTNGSNNFTRSCRSGSYYYELVQIYVSVTAVYSLSVNGSIDIYIYLYEDDFYSFLPLSNLILENPGACRGAQVKFSNHFQSHRKYLMIVKSGVFEGTGQFSVLVTGPYDVHMTDSRKYIGIFISLNKRYDI